MGKDSGKIFFNIAISTVLTGLLFYFIQDIIIWARFIEPGNLIQFGTPITIVIADVIMLVMLILFIILLFVGFDKTILLRVAVITGALYLFMYNLAHIFFPFYIDSGWDLGGYAPNIVAYFAREWFLSFIALFVLGLVSLFLVVFSLTKITKENITIEEKFTYIITLGVMFVFDIANLHWVKAYAKDVYSFNPFPYYGFFNIPFIVELILIIALILLIVSNIVNRGNSFIDIMALIMLNIYFILMISTAVVGSILDFTVSNKSFIPFPIGNTLLLLGTVLTFIASIIRVKRILSPSVEKY